MLKLLLLISFILHGVSLYWIFRLKKHPFDSKEIESLLAMYTEEIKTDNEKLLSRLDNFEDREGSEIKKDLTAEDLNDTKQMENTVSQQEDAAKSAVESQVDSGEDSVYEPPINESLDSFEPSIRAQVLTMSKQGVNRTEIAQKLGCGKGEVELLLKLYQ